MATLETQFESAELPIVGRGTHARPVLGCRKPDLTVYVRPYADTVFGMVSFIELTSFETGRAMHEFAESKTAQIITFMSRLLQLQPFRHTITGWIVYSIYSFIPCALHTHRYHTVYGGSSTQARNECWFGLALAICIRQTARVRLDSPCHFNTDCVASGTGASHSDSDRGCYRYRSHHHHHHHHHHHGSSDAATQRSHHHHQTRPGI